MLQFVVATAVCIQPAVDLEYDAEYFDRQIHANLAERVFATTL